MKLRKPSIYVVNWVSACLSFFLSASTAATYIFTAPNCTTTIINLESCALNAEYQHFIPSCSISCWDLLKCLYFVDTTETGDRGWNEAQRQGEDRVTLRITLLSRTPFYRYVYRPDNKKHWQGFAKYGIWVRGMLSIQTNWVKNFSKKALTTFSLASAGCEVKKGMKVQIAGGTERERERERERGWSVGTHLEVYYYYCCLPTCPYNSFQSRSVSFIKDQKTVPDFVTRLTAEKPLTTLPLLMWSPH
jgi:hypothetical protein